MWNTDVVNFQTAVTQNFGGVIKRVWSLNGNSVLCDVQDISREKVLKEYGFTEATQYKRVFDHQMSTHWKETEQVEFDGNQYLVRLVNDSGHKMSCSNHTMVILSRVV